MLFRMITFRIGRDRATPLGGRRGAILGSYN